MGSLSECDPLCALTFSMITLSLLPSSSSLLPFYQEHGARDQPCGFPAKRVPLCRLSVCVPLFLSARKRSDCSCQLTTSTRNLTLLRLSLSLFSFSLLILSFHSLVSFSRLLLSCCVWLCNCTLSAFFSFVPSFSLARALSFCLSVFLSFFLSLSLSLPLSLSLFLSVFLFLFR